MDLKHYTDKNSQLHLANEIGAAPSFVNQWVNNRRPIPPAYCVSIEQATKGAVMRWNLRPEDWHRIWPELIGIDGAPSPTEPEKAVSHG